MHGHAVGIPVCASLQRRPIRDHFSHTKNPRTLCKLSIPLHEKYIVFNHQTCEFAATHFGQSQSTWFSSKALAIRHLALAIPSNPSHMVPTADAVLHLEDRILMLSFRLDHEAIDHQLQTLQRVSSSLKGALLKHHFQTNEDSLGSVDGATVLHADHVNHVAAQKLNAKISSKH